MWVIDSLRLLITHSYFICLVLLQCVVYDTSNSFSQLNQIDSYKNSLTFWKLNQENIGYNDIVLKHSMRGILYVSHGCLGVLEIKGF